MRYIFLMETVRIFRLDHLPKTLVNRLRAGQEVVVARTWAIGRAGRVSARLHRSLPPMLFWLTNRRSHHPIGWLPQGRGEVFGCSQEACRVDATGSVTRSKPVMSID